MPVIMLQSLCFAQFTPIGALLGPAGLRSSPDTGAKLGLFRTAGPPGNADLLIVTGTGIGFVFRRHITGNSSHKLFPGQQLPFVWPCARLALFRTKAQVPGR